MIATTMANRAAGQLAEIGVIDPDRAVVHWQGTRDRPELAVLRDPASGVLYLSSSEHVDERFYADKEHPDLRALGGERDRVVAALEEDTARRVATIAALVTNRDWLDVGTGAGAILDRLRDRARTTTAVEPQGEWFAALGARGYTVFRSLREVPSDHMDVVSLFHVLEHFTHPVDELVELRRVLRAGGRAVIEVPHARDALIDLFDSPAFQAHTFWSEHLVLHTRESLRRLVEAAGLQVVAIEGVQRYPVANHLHWLARGVGGGQVAWSMLRDPELERAYAATLARMDATDTLVMTVTR